ncbi:MAG: M23 family metallopeptidase [Bacteroidetes bacterium]|nr:MAG: M23 family metallopeptidase [Bacteroidota bacterium]
MPGRKRPLKFVRVAVRWIAPLLAILLFGSSNPNRYPQDYFRSPLGIPLSLAGSFAEMRSNHFHSGLDIKTNGRSGYRVYASANGWVSRISVSSGGFGNAIYVTHPNGFMTVYAHLNRFSEPFSAYIKNLQYARESFSLDAFPAKGQFPVTKGDVIAFSGNSGSSSGPHLHFEVRNTATGWPENPLLFGFDIRDTRPPRIRRIKLYAMNDGSRLRIRDSRTGGWRRIRGNESVLLDVIRENGEFRFSRADRIEAAGEIGFGIQTFDYHDDSPNQLGAYRIDLESDGSPIFTSKMERFSFNLTRHINAHIDYAEYVGNRRWIQRSYVLPGNRLPIYDTVDRGILSIVQDSTYDLRYRISDTNGNEAVFSFQLYGNIKTDSSIVQKAESISNLKAIYNRPFTLERPGIVVRLSPKTLYDDTQIHYSQRSSGPQNRYAPVHRVHDDKTPVQEPYSISIDGRDIPIRLRGKVALGRVRSNGKMSYAGGSFRDGWVTSSVRSFGDYTITADTVAPSIRPINISSRKNMSRSSNIRIKIRDNFSGIKSYKGTIDGEWALFALDGKTGILRYTFDGRLQAGTHELRLVVEDQLGNERVYETTFRR